MRHVYFLIAFLLMGVVSVQARAEKRVALVIGNGNYAHAGRLANPVNDATDMAALLKSLRFDVVLGRDLTRDGMIQTLRAFRARADKSDIALLFYAGHGLQINGTNVLVPIDASLKDELDVEPQTMRLDTILSEMERAAPTNIVLLDACRNNPLAERLKRSIGARARSLGLSRGLAPVNPMTVDTLIMFATEPGDVADDGDGRNSPFTSALLRHLAQADEVSLILKDVVADVRAATKGKQRPQQLAAMERKLYLSGKPVGAANDGGEAARLRAELERLKAEARERADEQRPKAAAERVREEPAPRKSETQDPTKLAATASPRPAKSSPLTLDLRLQTVFPERMPVLPAQAKRMAAIAAELSDGRLNIKVLPAGALVPPSSMLDAVRKGMLDFAWWPASYPASRNSAFNILGGSVPFGLPPDKLVAWINGEGARLHRELYDTLSVHALPCAVVGADSGFWSSRTIGSMADLRGLKVRAVGLNAQVLQELGAVPQYLATGDLFPAMERGVIDALEYSIPKIDLELGFHQVARTLHIPGWHQPAMLLDLVVFQARWDSLSRQEQAILTATCQKLMLETLAAAGRDEREGLEALSGRGVLFREFPPPVLNALRKASDEVLAAESAKNALFKATLESYRRYQ
jgi:TRAP-type mannitol/chloroaromatic compound transport system substrate-binding protein/uncharacterized caspase-like protein